MENNDTTSKYFIRSRGKVLGPFTVERLKTLHARGQFSRVHEVSTDRKSWQPAGHLIDIFSPVSKGEEKGNATNLMMDPRRPPRLRQHSDGMEDGEWYYVENGMQRGPVSSAQLRSLRVSGRVDGQTSVWKEGFEDWVALRDIPGLTVSPVTGETNSVRSAGQPKTRSGRQRLNYFIGGGVLITTALVAVLLVGKFTSFTDRLPFVSPSGITASSSDTAITNAVGLVVCGMRGIGSDGTLIEFSTGTGSCFAVSPQGYLLTNKHVVEETQKAMRASGDIEEIKKQNSLSVLEPTIWVFFGSRQFEATLVYVSNNHDAALLKIERTNDSFFRLASSVANVRGADVLAYGFPARADEIALSDDEKSSAEAASTILSDIATGKRPTAEIKTWFKPRQFQYSLTAGTIGRVTVEAGGRKWIQHDTSINPGNSGGPLVSENGTVIGINTLMALDDRGSAANGLFFSIAVDQLREELDQYAGDIVWE